MEKKNAGWIPKDDDVKNAVKDIAWEFAAMLAAALEMGKGHCGPTNHQVQEVFLVHVRNLAEFFRKEADAFEDKLKNGQAKVPYISRKKDNIFAVDFCSAMLWTHTDFDDGKPLMIAINKTLSHMTYARFSGVMPFDACSHAHGTVTLMRRTWNGFLKALRPEFHADLLRHLHEHTKESDAWGLRPLNAFAERFENFVRLNNWRLNITPNGPIDPLPYSAYFPYSVNSTT